MRRLRIQRHAQAQGVPRNARPDVQSAFAPSTRRSRRRPPLPGVLETSATSLPFRRNCRSCVAPDDDVYTITTICVDEMPSLFSGAIYCYILISIGNIFFYPHNVADFICLVRYLTKLFVPYHMNSIDICCVHYYYYLISHTILKHIHKCILNNSIYSDY